MVLGRLPMLLRLLPGEGERLTEPVAVVVRVALG